jgi:hypothetical protein
LLVFDGTLIEAYFVIYGIVYFKFIPKYIFLQTKKSSLSARFGVSVLRTDVRSRETLMIGEVPLGGELEIREVPVLDVVHIVLVTRPR